MRVTVICLASALALTVGCSKKTALSNTTSASPAVAPAQTGGQAGLVVPHRKSGLWVMAMDATGGPGVQLKTQACVDSATDKDLAWRGPRSQAKNCSKTEMHPTLGGVTFDSVCKAGPRTITTHGVVKGDFNKSYDVQMTNHIDPPPPGMTSDMKLSMKATWAGPCPADMKPGEMKMDLSGMRLGR
jgi:hypothetical protein